MYSYQQKHISDISYRNAVLRVWNGGNERDEKRLLQPFVPYFESGLVEPYIALMPDYHPAPPLMNGCVVASASALFPSIIGCDIGCGVAALPLPLEADALRNRLETLYRKLIDSIPTGKKYNSEINERVEARPLWEDDLRAPVLTNRNRKMLRHQFASLGWGNHFLEIQKDRSGCVWIMLHAGSRMLGALVQEYYQSKAERVREGGRKNGASYISVSSDLGRDYLWDIDLVSKFARDNRTEIMHRTLDAVRDLFPHQHPVWDVDPERDAIDAAHNTISLETHWDREMYVHRKGACEAGSGRIGLVPGSMGSPSFVVEGRGNPYSFRSCSHGAGRVMSRGLAFKKISLRQLKDRMKGVVFAEDARLRDEAPQVYKDIRIVMKNQKDLVGIVTELTPLAVVKGF